MRKDKINKIIGIFAIFGAFLIVSTGFIQPVQAEIVEKSILTTNSGGELEDCLINLVYSKELRDETKKILSGEDVNDHLKEFKEKAKDNENYQPYINILAHTYREKLDNILASGESEDSENIEQLPDYIENEDLMIQSDIFDFSVKVVKKNRNERFLNKGFTVIDKILNLFKSSRLFSRLFDRNNEEYITTNSDEKKIKLLNDGEEIVRGSLIEVSGYLTLLELILVDVNCELNDDESPVDEYFKILDEGIDFANDRDVEYICRVIAERNHIAEKVNKVFLVEPKERETYMKDVLEEITELEDFSGLRSLIESKYPAFKEFSIDSTLLGVLCIIAGLGCLGLAAYCGFLGYIAAIFSPTGYLILLGAVIALFFAILFFVAGGYLIFFK